MGMCLLGSEIGGLRELSNCKNRVLGELVCHKNVGLWEQIWKKEGS